MVHGRNAELRKEGRYNVTIGVPILKGHAFVFAPYLDVRNPGGVAPRPPQKPQPRFHPTHTRSGMPSTCGDQLRREGQGEAVPQQARVTAVDSPDNRPAANPRLAAAREEPTTAAPPTMFLALRCETSVCDDAVCRTSAA
jgi:hypothetical protein